MVIKLEEFFTQFQVSAYSGDHDFPLRFPRRIDAYTSADLWRELRRSWRNLNKSQKRPNPFIITAEWLSIVAVLRERVRIAEHGDKIAIDYLIPQKPKSTYRDIQYCHIYQDGKLFLYDEQDDPSTQLTIDTHLVETDIGIGAFQTASDLVSAVRWRLEHVVREITEPCYPQH